VTPSRETLRAAHLARQPYFLQLAELQLPGVTVARTESYISSTPTGTHAEPLVFGGPHRRIGKQLL
jgi:hypothetical protein